MTRKVRECAESANIFYQRFYRDCEKTVLYFYIFFLNIKMHELKQFIKNRNAFFDFLATQFSEENLLFYETIVDWKRLPPNSPDRGATAISIRETVRKDEERTKDRKKGKKKKKKNEQAVPSKSWNLELESPNAEPH
jgi:hypothetical protein